MQQFAEVEPVLAAYPADCRPSKSNLLVRPAASAGRSSGGSIHHEEGSVSAAGLPNIPDKARLGWIHAVIAHVVRQRTSTFAHAAAGPGWPDVFRT